MKKYLFVTFEGDVSYSDVCSSNDLQNPELVTIIDTVNQMHYMNGGWFGIEEKEEYDG